VKDQEIHAFINEVDPDDLEINGQLRITGIRYGEGPQREVVAGDKLCVLGKDILLRSSREFVHFDNGKRYVLKNLFAENERDALLLNENTHFPFQLVVSGKKAKATNSVSLVRISDIRYVQGHDVGQNESFEISCIHGRGGIACFIDKKGEYQIWNPYIIGDPGNAIGSVGVLVLIEWENAKPLYRSPYVVILRKGIRYPDDIWLSRTTLSPLMSPGDGEFTRRRFIFQSREPAGGSTDIYVADFDGGNMVNLSQDNVDAFDGFFDDDGVEVVGWVDERHIKYSSMQKGTKQVAIRMDPIYNKKE
jgi:hypothetical protein